MLSPYIMILFFLSLFFSGFCVEMLPISIDLADDKVWLTVLVVLFIGAAFYLFLFDGNALFVLHASLLFMALILVLLKIITFNVVSMTF